MRTLKLPTGEEITGEDTPYRVVTDGAVTVEADDGAVLRLRPIVINVVRTDQKSPEGERVYLVQCINQVLLVKPGKEDVT